MKQHIENINKEEIVAREETWIRNNLWCKIHIFPKVDISCKECRDLIPKRGKMIQELANEISSPKEEIECFRCNADNLIGIESGRIYKLCEKHSKIPL